MTDLSCCGGFNGFHAPTCPTLTQWVTPISVTHAHPVPNYVEQGRLYTQSELDAAVAKEREKYERELLDARRILFCAIRAAGGTLRITTADVDTLEAGWMIAREADLENDAIIFTAEAR